MALHRGKGISDRDIPFLVRIEAGVLAIGGRVLLLRIEDGLIRLAERVGVVHGDVEILERPDLAFVRRKILFDVIKLLFRRHLCQSVRSSSLNPSRSCP